MASGLAGRGVSARDQHFHAGTLQRRRQSVELAQGEPLRFGLAGRTALAGRRCWPRFAD